MDFSISLERVAEKRHVSMLLARLTVRSIRVSTLLLPALLLAIACSPHVQTSRPNAAAESSEPRIRDVKVTPDAIIAYLVDGRVLSVPLVWSWRLSEATPRQRARFRIIGDGQGVHWPDIDEDISIEGMLHGVPAHRPQTLVHFRNGRARGQRKPHDKRLRRSDRTRRSTAKG